MRRRHFLLLLAAAPFLQAQKRQRDDGEGTITRFIASRMLQKALSEGWQTLPMGVLLCRFGELFLGTLYAGGTLESPTGEEVCRVDFTGMDCFTFVEATLCLGRALKRGKPTFEGFLEEVRQTRYREGRCEDYSWRLHYTADWLYENERRGVLLDVTRELGGEPIRFDVWYMSRNPRLYPALRARPELIPRIAEIERQISARQYWYIPRDRLPAVLERLQPGDILAFTTRRQGLDYGHMGLAYPLEGRIHLLHASQSLRKVVIDKPLEEYLASVPTHTGVTIARPREVG